MSLFTSPKTHADLSRAYFCRWLSRNSAVVLSRDSRSDPSHLPRKEASKQKTRVSVCPIAQQRKRCDLPFRNRIEQQSTTIKRAREFMMPLLFVIAIAVLVLCGGDFLIPCFSFVSIFDLTVNDSFLFSVRLSVTSLSLSIYTLSGWQESAYVVELVCGKPNCTPELLRERRGRWTDGCYRGSPCWRCSTSGFGSIATKASSVFIRTDQEKLSFYAALSPSRQRW